MDAAEASASHRSPGKDSSQGQPQLHRAEQEKGEKGSNPRLRHLPSAFLTQHSNFKEQKHHLGILLNCRSDAGSLRWSPGLALSTSSRMTLKLLVQEPHFEQQRSN